MNNSIPKIAFLISNLGGGGAETVAVNIINYFQEQKISHILILKHKVGPNLNKMNSFSKIYELKTNNLIKIIAKIIFISKKESIDVLCSFLRFNNLQISIANIFIRKRIILREATTFNDFRDILQTGSLIKKIKINFLSFLLKKFYQRANMIIGNSNDTINDVEEYLNIKINQKAVIGNPIAIKNIEENANEIINDHKFNNLTKPIIISVSRLSKEKNIELLIKSFREVVKIVPTACLVIIGKGSEKKNLIDLVDKLNLGEKVHFLGYVDNPFKYLVKSNLLVLSSKYEGFGNVLVEALSLGVPVVSTNCPGGPKDILDNGKYGKLAPSEDIEAFSKAIIHQLQCKFDKRELIKRAEFYSVDNVSREYLKVIYNL